jgi:hypothetical protein
MDPESSPDPTFRIAVEDAIAEDRPAVLVSVTGWLDGSTPELEVTAADSVSPDDVPLILERAAMQYRASRQ